MHTGKYAVLAKHDLFQRGVIGHNGNDHIAVSGCFFGSLGDGSTCDGLRFLPCAIIDGQMIPCSYQPRGHVAPHMAHADEANGWLRSFLHGHDIALLFRKSPREERHLSLLASKGKAESLSAGHSLHSFRSRSSYRDR